MIMDIEWISVSEAAQLTGYSTPHLRELVRDKRIHARKIVTVWQIDRASLMEYVDDMTKKGSKRGPKTDQS